MGACHLCSVAPHGPHCLSQRHGVGVGWMGLDIGEETFKYDCPPNPPPLPELNVYLHVL